MQPVENYLRIIEAKGKRQEQYLDYNEQDD